MPAQPLWREIHAALRAEIGAGRWRTGDKLPTEKELSERFDVNRHTVRRALAELTAEGAIAVRRGSGAYVAEGIIDYRLGGSVKFSQNIAQLGRTPAHHLVRAAVETAEERVAAALGLKPGSAVAVIETVGEADGLPVLFARHVFPDRRFPGIIEAFCETLSFSAALTRFGVTDYRRAWTRITASPASRQLALRLRQADTLPVMRSEGLNLDMAGEPIELAVGWWAASRTQFVVDGG